MSHRVTFKSNITDPDLAKAALIDCKMPFEPLSENVVRITGGPMANATINLQTGEAVSDSDYHSRADLEDLGGLRQAYSEAEFRRQAVRQGATIESRKINEHGEVKILCRMHG